MTGPPPEGTAKAVPATRRGRLISGLRWIWRGSLDGAGGQRARGDQAAHIGQVAHVGQAADVGEAAHIGHAAYAREAAHIGKAVPAVPAPAAETHMPPGTQAKPSAPAGLPHPESQVPRLLHQSAAWSWRLLLTGLIIYLAFRLAVDLRLVTLPFIAAMLLTALLHPLAAWLRARGFSRLLATWCCLLLALVVIAGVVTLVVNQVADQYTVLYAEVQRTSSELEHTLAGPPFHLNAQRLQGLSKNLLNYISQHKSVVAGAALTGGKYATELGAGLALMLFTAFFLLKDGARIWSWLISSMRPDAKRRTAQAGDQAWRALVNYVRGTTLVAAIHAVLLGLAMWILHVPLLVPLVALIFIAAFVPILGILVVGALAILVALVTKGWVAAVILLAVLIVENQIEGHLLQPFVVGRIIRLHPLAIILVLAVGGIVAGVPGAIIAVPVAAVITYAWPALRADPPPD